MRLSAQVARAHARLGNHHEFERAAVRARDYQAQLPLHGTGLFGVDAVRITSYDASSYGWLGQANRAPAAAEEAIGHYRSFSRPLQAPPARDRPARPGTGALGARRTGRRCCHRPPSPHQRPHGRRRPRPRPATRSHPAAPLHRPNSSLPQVSEADRSRSQDAGVPAPDECGRRRPLGQHPCVGDRDTQAGTEGGHFLARVVRGAGRNHGWAPWTLRGPPRCAGSADADQPEQAEP